MPWKWLNEGLFSVQSIKSPSDRPSNPSKEEEVSLRREGGLWLKRRREELGLSQRDVADCLGLKFYSFISQVENGRAPIPPELLRDWAAALRIPTAEFARTMLRYFSPILYGALFADQSPSGQPSDGHRHPPAQAR